MFEHIGMCKRKDWSCGHACGRPTRGWFVMNQSNSWNREDFNNKEVDTRCLSEVRCWEQSSLIRVSQSTITTISFANKKTQSRLPPIWFCLCCRLRIGRIHGRMMWRTHFCCSPIPCVLLGFWTTGKPVKFWKKSSQSQFLLVEKTNLVDVGPNWSLTVLRRDLPKNFLSESMRNRNKKRKWISRYRNELSN